MSTRQGVKWQFYCWMFCFVFFSRHENQIWSQKNHYKSLKMVSFELMNPYNTLNSATVKKDNNNKYLTLNTNFDALSKWNEPDISLFPITLLWQFDVPIPMTFKKLCWRKLLIPAHRSRHFELIPMGYNFLLQLIFLWKTLILEMLWAERCQKDWKIWFKIWQTIRKKITGFGELVVNPKSL